MTKSNTISKNQIGFFAVAPKACFPCATFEVHPETQLPEFLQYAEMPPCAQLTLTVKIY